MLYNGTEFFTPRGGYTRGPWGPNGEDISCPTRSVTLAMWAMLGWLPYITDDVPEHYSGGVPVIIKTATEYRCTYPNPVLEAASWRDQLTKAIQAKKITKRDGGFMVGAMLFDSDANANIAYLNYNAALQAALAAHQPDFVVDAWKASGITWVTMNAALFAQVYVAFAANNQAAFAWQDQMDAALASAPDTYAALKAIEDAINEA